MSDEDVTKRRTSVLAQPGYRRLWAARTVSQWGDVIQFTTVALLALRLTGSGVGVSGAVLADVVPLIALAPLAGPLVDRLPRVNVLVGADLVRVVLAAVLALFHEQIAVVYAVALGLSAGSAFFNPAAGSLLPSLVDDRRLSPGPGVRHPLPVLRHRPHTWLRTLFGWMALMQLVFSPTTSTPTARRSGSSRRSG